MQGAAAPSYNNVNCSNDDENSQAEGSSTAASTSRPTVSNEIINNNANNNENQNQVQNVHYENIYESIDQIGAAAPAPAVGVIPQQPVLISNPVHPRPQQQPVQPPPPQQQLAYCQMAYREDLYNERYDVPRSFRIHNLNDSEIHSNSMGPCFSRRLKQRRSRLDAESNQYINTQNSNYLNRYENIYEHLGEDPVYLNTSGSLSSGGNRIYGRLNVIGHGIGRIERHLSSSCGNIDNYNGNYAILGHSHLGTVGRFRIHNNMNNSKNNNNITNNLNIAPNVAVPSAIPQNTGQHSSKDVPSVKSFFSCLNGENSHSMNNLNNHKIINTDNNVAPAVSTSSTNGLRITGAIPKQIKNKLYTNNGQASSSTSSSSSASCSTTPATIPPTGVSSVVSTTPPTQQQPTAADQNENNTLNRLPKSSLQWLLVNKWLPLWINQEENDYKLLDFNFMFSRNGTSGATPANAGHNSTDRRSENGLVRYGIHYNEDYIPPIREYPTMNGSYPRVIRKTTQLSRLQESTENRPRNMDDVNASFNFNRSREVFDQSAPTSRSRSGSPNMNKMNKGGNTAATVKSNWTFNLENNSFRPAASGSSCSTVRDIKRITDGTFNTKENKEKKTVVVGPSAPANQLAQDREMRPSTSTDTSENSEEISTSPESSESINYDICKEELSDSDN